MYEKEIEVKTKNGYVFSIKQPGVRYTVYCLAPEEKKGWISRQTKYMCEDKPVYKTLSYTTLGRAVSACERYADLGSNFHAYDYNITCA